MGAAQHRGEALEGARVSDYLTGVVLFNRLTESVLAEGAPLTFTAWRILTLLLLCSDTGVRVGEVARRLALSPSMVSDCAAGLEERGLVGRRSDPNDLKAVWVDLTPEGERVLRDSNELLLEGTACYWNKKRMGHRDTLIEAARECLVSAGFSDVQVDRLDPSICFAFSSNYHLRSNVNWIKSSYNLGFGDARLLMLLVEEGRPLKMLEAAELLDLQPSSVTASVRCLGATGGCVERRKNPANRREVFVTPTPKGARLGAEIRARFLDANVSMIGSMVKMMGYAPVAKVKSLAEKVGLGSSPETL